MRAEGDSKMMKRSWVMLCAALLVGLLVAPMASADISETIFNLAVTNTNGSSATFSVPSTALEPDPGTGGYIWELEFAEELWDFNNNDLVATLNQATVRIVEDSNSFPRIISNFQINNGEADSEFLVESPVVSFDPILPAAYSEGRATASFTLTDHNDGIPAELAGLDPDNGLGIFTAYYNGYPAGTEFANLVAYMSVDNGGSESASQAFPPVGTWAPIGVDVNDISFNNAFTLTGSDQMSGQTSFMVTPEPGALMLLGVGLAFLARRR